MLKAIMFKFNVQIEIASKKISFRKISSTPQLLCLYIGTQLIRTPRKGTYSGGGGGGGGGVLKKLLGGDASLGPWNP